MNRGWSYPDRVRDEAAGLSISGFYSQKYSHSDITCWRRRLAGGEIEHNGLRAQDDLLLAVGDQLVWHRPPWQEPEVPLQFEVIHDDGDLLIVNKPSGLPVMPAGGFLEHTLLRLLERRWPVDPPRPVHRLGRGTSGLLICARRSRSRAWLSAALRDHGKAVKASAVSIEKIYRCRTVKAELEAEGRIEMPIGALEHPRLGRLWCADPRGLPSRSDYRLLRREADGNLLEVTICTGRPHQIRIHLAAIGAPLLGDPLYVRGGRVGDVDALPGDLGYQLHAHRLRLRDPKGQRLCFEAPLPIGLR
ncbi:MAG: RluA family pseudouridine synthase [Candidatus Latescibacteria bacterium]|nr:RluA family pseudouridine synthase [Candidatus Latescibacterota bacterium]